MNKNWKLCNALPLFIPSPTSVYMLMSRVHILYLRLCPVSHVPISCLYLCSSLLLSVGLFLGFQSYSFHTAFHGIRNALASFQNCLFSFHTAFFQSALNADRQNSKNLWSAEHARFCNKLINMFF